MSVQMTFKQQGAEFKASHGERAYLIARRGGGYIAMVYTPGAPRPVGLPGGWFFENRGQAEEACNVHATRAGRA